MTSVRVPPNSALLARNVSGSLQPEVDPDSFSTSPDCDFVLQNPILFLDVAFGVPQPPIYLCIAGCGRRIPVGERYCCFRIPSQSGILPAGDVPSHCAIKFGR